jgi:hypothetical protein
MKSRQEAKVKNKRTTLFRKREREREKKDQTEKRTWGRRGER